MSLIERIQESGDTDTSIDDWFYRGDVKHAVETLRDECPECGDIIYKIFGDMTLGYDDINEEDEE